MKTNPRTRHGLLLVATFASAILVFGCGTGSSVSRTSDQGTATTGDQLGPPGHIQSEPLTTQHPSSNTGGVSGMGSNTNLNTPPAVPAGPTQSYATVTSTETEPSVPLIAQVTPPPTPTKIETPPPPAAPVVAPPMPEPVHEVTKKE